MAERESNPMRYHELSAPVPRHLFEERLEAFFAEFKELRIKHKLADVHVVVRGTVIVQDDLLQEATAIPVMTSGHFGDSTLQEPMLAWAFGRAGANRAHNIDNYKADGQRSGRRDLER